MPPSRAAPGSPAERRIGLALFLAGFATFSLLYCVQPLLPLFADEFGLAPAASALALSLSTFALAGAIVVAGALSERLDRRRLMAASMAAAAVLTLGVAALRNWHAMLVLRTLEGLVLGGVPAVAMAYLADQIAPEGLGRAMGRYVAGNAFGGMTGRVLVGALAGHLGWRASMALLGALDLAATLAFLALLPRHGRGAPLADGARADPGIGPAPRPARLADHLAAWRAHLRDPALRALFAISFFAMGVFVTVYNYLGFRLMRPPFGLGQAAIGAIFCAYVFGVVSSAVGGALADRRGRGPMMAWGLALMALGVLLTLPDHLVPVIAGLVLLTVGFFIVHAVASGWVGWLAASHKGHAASLYLLAYYLGSSVLGAVGGMFWSAGRWPAVAGFAAAGLVATGVAAARVRRAAG